MGLAAKVNEANEGHKALQQAIAQGQPPPPKYNEIVVPAFPENPLFKSGLEAAIEAKLVKCIKENSLQPFYPAEKLRQIVQALATKNYDVLAKYLKANKDIATDFAQLVLFDIIIYLDDSGSMTLDTRIDDAKAAITMAAEIAVCFDADGISARFINSNIKLDNVKSESDISNVIKQPIIKPDGTLEKIDETKQVLFSGGTMIGTNLKDKIIDPFVLNVKAKKPLLVIIITDGDPSGEDRNTLERVMTETCEKCKKIYGTKDMVSYMLAQVGNDKKATRFLQEIDENSPVNEQVDTVADYETEEVKLKKIGVNLTPEMYVAKLMLGPIDNAYDMDPPRYQ